jgi:hypothetical protein
VTIGTNLASSDRLSGGWRCSLWQKVLLEPLKLLRRDLVLAMHEHQLGDPEGSVEFAAPGLRTAGCQIAYLPRQVAEQHMPKVVDRHEGAGERLPLGLVLKLAQQGVLLLIDFQRVDRDAREIEHRRFVRRDELLDLLNRPRGATPVSVPYRVQNIPTSRSLVSTICRLIAACGRTLVSGVAWVSHMTGNSTIPSAAALSAFQSWTTATAACRASGMSDGDAMST